ncbi:MAG: rhodanese-like domain-containing protein [Phycisphaeraceae bacterium]
MHARFLKLVEQARTRIQEVDVATVKRKLDREEPFYLVDVRESGEWDAGRLPQAVHLSKGLIEHDIERRIPDVDADIVCYCGGGYRSALVAENLNRMGYRHVSSMAGGYHAWRQAGLPVDREAPAS